MHVDNKDISADSKIELKGISEIYDETLDLFSLRCSIEIIVYTVLFSRTEAIVFNKSGEGKTKNYFSRSMIVS